jgi:hypothetical protein
VRENASLRSVLALLIAAIAISSAVWLVAGYEDDGYQEGGGGPAGNVPPGEQSRKAEWQNPLAILIGATGGAIAIAILVGEHRPASRSVGEAPLD